MEKRGGTRRTETHDREQRVRRLDVKRGRGSRVKSYLSSYVVDPSVCIELGYTSTVTQYIYIHNRAKQRLYRSDSVTECGKNPERFNAWPFALLD